LLRQDRIRIDGIRQDGIRPVAIPGIVGIPGLRW
jgi:hypothetical protein